MKKLVALTVITPWYLELLSFLYHQFSIALFWLVYIKDLIERNLLYNFLTPHRQAILDNDWKDGKGLRLHIRLWMLSVLLPKSTPHGPLFSNPLHLPNRFLLKVYPSLVTNDPVYLARLQHMHYRFIWERDDTPIASFIRLVLDVENIRRQEMKYWIRSGDEIQYFWRRGLRGYLHPCHWLYGGKWLVEDIPDPKRWFGEDPVRYALAACVAEHMAETFNWRMDRLKIRRDTRDWDNRLGPPIREKAPSWCASVGPSPIRRVVDEQKRKVRERWPRNQLSDIFYKRNLIAKKEFLFFA